MYGVVLMMALSGGAQAPAWDNSAAEPVAKYGDHGHKEYRLFGRRNCHGGGGCCGGGYGGCHGGCHGGGGCCGGGYGSYGSMGYAGGYYGYSPYISSGVYSFSPYGGTIYSGAMPYDTQYQYGVPTDQGGLYGSDNPERLSAPADRERATLRVRLPADARLTVDGSPTISTNSVRLFATPPLQGDKDFKYSLRMEVTRDGKKIERTKDVTVRRGQQTDVTFDVPEDTSPPK